MPAVFAYLSARVFVISIYLCIFKIIFPSALWLELVSSCQTEIRLGGSAYAMGRETYLGKESAFLFDGQALSLPSLFLSFSFLPFFIEGREKAGKRRQQSALHLLPSNLGIGIPLPHFCLSLLLGDMARTVVLLKHAG